MLMKGTATNINENNLPSALSEKTYINSLKDLRKLKSNDGQSDSSSSESCFEEDSENDFQAFQRPDQTKHQNLSNHKHPLSLNGGVQTEQQDSYALNNSNRDSEGDGSTTAAANYNKTEDERREIEMRRKIIDSLPSSMPIINKQFSLKPDMMFGWKPKENVHGAPIPLYFDYETFEIPINRQTDEEFQVHYYGPRFKDSLEMHRAYSNMDSSSYKFKFPPNLNVIDAIIGTQKRKRKDDDREFIGMNPSLVQPQTNQGTQGVYSMIMQEPVSFQNQQTLIFDSKFESGNLDMAIRVKENEYDLYMRVDSNTRGHHQWFYFSTQNMKFKGKMKFNIVNFTKKASLYHQGMRINILSQKDVTFKTNNSNTSLSNEGWIKGGENIFYKQSKLCQVSFGQKTEEEQIQANKMKRYFQVSFEYDFKYENDKVFFSYSVPYTFTKLYNFLKANVTLHYEAFTETPSQFIKESILCKSLSGLEIPMLTVTSRVNKLNFEEVDPSEFISQESIPLNKYKKHMIICSRVHPGESNASYIMQGFIKFITSPTNSDAIELRKRIVFKIVPMTNPDGVIVGNYRVSLAGNDLNRQFITPDARLHPSVCAIKAMISSIIQNAKEPDPISAFIDIHGHSRKKAIFIYGPYFPLHNERYLKMRVLPQLLSERTEMFRFYSCKFRIQKSKLKAARVVLWKEFNIMNCFTLEASFHGYIDKDRQTIELTTEMFEKMGETLGQGFAEYQSLVEEDEKQHLLLKQQIKNKKKKMKAKDLVNAYSKQQDALFQQNNIHTMNNGNANVSNSFEQFFSSEVDETSKPQKSKISQTVNTTGRSQSSMATQKNNLTKPNNEIEQNYDSKSSKHQPLKLSQRAQSFNINRLKPPQEQRESSFNSGRPEIVVEAKRSSAEDSDSSQKGSKKNKKKNSQETELIEPGKKKKPFRIKKQKNEDDSNQQNITQKRTLKHIYNLLKRDMKGINCIQGGGRENPQQNTNARMESSDEEEEDDCDCDKSMSEDELPLNDLQELQSDIINALDKFDTFFNNNKKQNQQNGKKDPNTKQKGNKTKKGDKANIVQILDSEKGKNILDLLPTVMSSKNETQNKGKSEVRGKGSFIIKANKKSNKFQQEGYIKTSKMNKSDQNSHNMTCDKGTISALNQQFGVAQTQSQVDMLNRDKELMERKGEKHRTQLEKMQEIKNNTYMLTNSNSIMGIPLGEQYQHIKSNKPNKQNAYNLDQTQYKAGQLQSKNEKADDAMYQIISHNIKNLIKQKYAVGHNQQKQQQFSGTSQVLHQSRSQDRCQEFGLPQNSSSYQLDGIITKSFEEINLHSRPSLQKQKLQSNYKKESLPDNLESFIKQSIISQQKYILPYANNDKQPVSLVPTSKSSRIIFSSKEQPKQAASNQEKRKSNLTPMRIQQEIQQLTDQQIQLMVMPMNQHEGRRAIQSKEFSTGVRNEEARARLQKEFLNLAKESGKDVIEVRQRELTQNPKNEHQRQNNQSKNQSFVMTKLNKTQIGNYNISSPHSANNETTFGSCTNLDNGLSSNSTNPFQINLKNSNKKAGQTQVQTIEVVGSETNNKTFTRRNKNKDVQKTVNTYFLAPNDYPSSSHPYVRLDGSVAGVTQPLNLNANQQMISNKQMKKRLKNYEQPAAANRDYIGFLSDGEKEDYLLRKQVEELSQEHFKKHSLQPSQQVMQSTDYERRVFAGREKRLISENALNHERQGKHLRSHISSEFHNSISKVQRMGLEKDEQAQVETRMKKKKKKVLKLKD